MSSTSILEESIREQTRPYSQSELIQNREQLARELRLSSYRAIHPRCQHFYSVRSNSRKEKDILDGKGTDVGNCSVCWKLSKTPRRIKDQALDLISEYNLLFEEESTYQNFYRNEIESIYYKWLYDVEPKRKHTQFTQE
jgi:hypothetical protein